MNSGIDLNRGDAGSVSSEVMDERQFFFSGQSEDLAVRTRLAIFRREKDNLDLLAEELPNAWGMIEYAYHNQDWKTVNAFQDALQHFLNLSGYWEESIRLNLWASEAAEKDGDRVSLARWTFDRATIYNQQGRFREAEELYQQSEDLYEELGLPNEVLNSRHMRSMVVRAMGRILQAQELNREIIREAQALKMDNWLGHPLYVQALLARDLGRYEEAHRVIRESLAIFERRGGLEMIAHCYHFIGEVMLLEGDTGKEVEAYLLSSLDYSRQAGVLRRLPATQRLVGDLYVLRGEWEKAEQIYQEALQAINKLGDQSLQGRLLVALARLKIKQRILGEAGDLLESAMRVFRNVGDARWVTGVYALQAQVNFLQVRLWRAVVSLARGFHIALRSGLVRPQIIFGIFKRWGKF